MICCTTPASWYMKRAEGFGSLLIWLVVAIGCASAAPTGAPDGGRVSGFPFTWRSIEANCVQIATLIVTFVAFSNVGCIALWRPRRIPSLWGHMAIGIGLLGWIFHANCPRATQLRDFLISLWFLAESSYMSRMCCVANNGRGYFWASVALGLSSSMIMAALQGESRPTLIEMMLDGLPLLGLLVGIMACLMPHAVGIAN